MESEVFISEDGKYFESFAECRGRGIRNISVGKYGFIAEGVSIDGLKPECVFISEKHDERKIVVLEDVVSGTLGNDTVYLSKIDGSSIESIAVSLDSLWEGRTSEIRNNGLRGKQFRAISAGKWHCAAVTVSGDLYTWGRGTEGQLAADPYRSAIANRSHPKLVQHFCPITAPREKIKKVSCSNNFTIVLTERGSIYGCGEGYYGQLGNGTKSNAYRPVKCSLYNISSNCTFSRVCTGDSHVLALTESGKLCSWGCNINGQLGHGDLVSRSVPVFVNIQGKVVDICAFGLCSGAVDKDGNAYVWGKQRCASNKEFISAPFQLDLHEKHVSRLFLYGIQSIAALIPLKITEQSTNMIPVNKSIRYKLSGCGIYDSNNISIRFTYVRTDSRKIQKVSRGSFVAPLHANCLPEIVCCAPTFNCPCKVTVEISINPYRENYVDTGCVVSYFKEPAILSVKPAVMKLSSGSSICILASNLESFKNASNLTVAFRDFNNDVAFQAEGLLSRSHNTDSYYETDEYSISCSVPPLHNRGPHFFHLTILPNPGFDHQHEPECSSYSLIVHNAQVDSVSPMSVPYSSERRVLLRGTGLFGGPGLGVRLKVEIIDNKICSNDGESLYICTDRAVYEDDCISFYLPGDELCPTFNQTLGAGIEITFDGSEYIYTEKNLLIFKENTYRFAEERTYIPVTGGKLTLRVSQNDGFSPFRQEDTMAKIASEGMELDLLVPILFSGASSETSDATDVKADEWIIDIPNLIQVQNNISTKCLHSMTISVSHNRLDFSSPLQFFLYNVVEITQVVPSTIKDMKNSTLMLHGNHIQKLNNLQPIVTIESVTKNDAGSIVIDGDIVEVGLNTSKESNFAIQVVIPNVKQLKSPIKILSVSLDREVFFATYHEVKVSKN